MGRGKTENMRITNLGFCLRCSCPAPGTRVGWEKHEANKIRSWGTGLADGKIQTAYFLMFWDSLALLATSVYPSLQLPQAYPMSSLLAGKGCGGLGGYSKALNLADARNSASSLYHLSTDYSDLYMDVTSPSFLLENAEMD